MAVGMACMGVLGISRRLVVLTMVMVIVLLGTDLGHRAGAHQHQGQGEQALAGVGQGQGDRHSRQKDPLLLRLRVDRPNRPKSLGISPVLQRSQG